MPNWTPCDLANFVIRRATRTTAPDPSPTATDIPNARPRIELVEVSSSNLDEVLVRIESGGGIVASMERVRGNNAAWKLRVRYPKSAPMPQTQEFNQLRNL